MKAFKTIFILFFFLNWSNSFTQDYRNETLKVNNYVVKDVGYSKELSDNITPYQEALGIEGLSFKRILPEDPLTDDPENWIRIGSRETKDFFMLVINEGEWVSGFTNCNSKFQISIGDRIFKIGDTKEETLIKLDLGYEFYKNNQNVVRIFYYEASLTIGFKDDKIRCFNFDNLFY